LEASANWNADGGEQWTVPIHLMGSKVVRVGPQMASITAGFGWFVAEPTDGPSSRLRAVVTLLFPK
jgi:hypothetical protein